MDPGLEHLSETAPHPTLPEEVILRIFRLAADDALKDIQAHEWWNLPLAYEVFFNTASLVSRRWYQLTRTFKSTLCVPASGPRSYAEDAVAPDALGAFYAWQAKRSKVLKIVPERFRACSLDASHITSLSVDLAFWTCPALKGFLESIACRASALHLYANASIYTLNWSAATCLHSNANLKKLSLQELRVDLDDAYTVIPCKRQTVVLDRVVFSLEADFPSIFPRQGVSFFINLTKRN